MENGKIFISQNGIFNAFGIEEYELKPNNNRKSFYGKASVFIVKGKRFLRSYDTIVAYKDKNGTIHRLWDNWSYTTGRHIVAFGGPCKSEWDKMQVEKMPNIRKN